MEWSKEKPTEPGWYWVKDLVHKTFFMVHVVKTKDGLWFEEFNDDNWRYAYEYSDQQFEWQPIDPPK